ncbi:hypothetical protein [uncultured Chryseobacterium sp.]|jgi:hypothetical protein|uniref:hypothetical protein n=1 Tax=uncultured Chryseobacterium sp. TaxID=259322 RepID=UPI00261DE17F|nr:hypothetical protein [uncultured Chryseobacterium sp.]
MKKIIFILILSVNFFYSQKCQLDYNIKSDGINDSIKIFVKNNDRKSLKIPNRISSVFFQLKEIEKFDNETNIFVRQETRSKDINCTFCHKKLVNLKSQKSHTYIHFKSNILMFNNITEKGLYRFKIYAYIIDFPSGCETLESEWMSYEIK